MTLRAHPPNAAERRDEMMRLAHGKAEKAADRAMRRFLRQVMAAIRGAGLTASIDPVDPFTVEQARTWWAEASEQDLLPALRAIWRAGYSDTSTVASSSDAVADYMATVSDRLSPTTSPSLPHDAFDLARRALTEELAAGSSIPEIGRRLAAEFSWEQDAPYWESRKLAAQNEIDAILDPLGEPGSYAREAAKRADPRVVALRQISNEATLKLDSLEGPWRARATLIARTESTAAFNHAGLSALREEEAVTKVWLATPGPRTRASHQAANGQEVPIDQPFQVGGHPMQAPGDPSAPAREVCNCFPASVVVDYPSIRSAMRRWYDGDVIHLRFASGNELTGTPNHPVLGVSGWITLDRLNEGDHLVRAGIRRKDSTAPNEHRRPSEIGEVYRSAQVADSAKRVAVAPLDLHGNGSHGDVEVVAVHGPLRFYGEPARDEQIDHFGLTVADSTALAARRGFDPIVSPTTTRLGQHGISPRGLSVERAGSSLLVSHLRHADPVRFALPPGRDAGGEQPPSHARTAELESFAQTQLALACDVSLDEIVEINVSSFSDHVFTLDTGVGWYTANGIISQNCRCTIIGGGL